MPLWANRVLKVTNQSVNSAKPNICGVSYVLVLGLGTGAWKYPLLDFLITY